MPTMFRCSVIALATLGLPATSIAQATGSLDANFNSDAPVRGRPVMVSVIRNGTVLVQNEVVLPAARGFDGLPVGPFDVRVEGDGLVTEVKRGVQVMAGQRLDLHFVMRLGQGAHMVEYAIAGLSREEVAAHLQRLDSAVAALQRATGRPN